MCQLVGHALSIDCPPGVAEGEESRWIERVWPRRVAEIFHLLLEAHVLRRRAKVLLVVVAWDVAVVVDVTRRP